MFQKPNYFSNTRIHTVLHGGKESGHSHAIETNLSLAEMHWVIQDLMKANEKYNIIHEVR